MDSAVFGFFQLAVLLFSVIIHEVSHGLMALKLGDDTAKREGRLTLNPISHIDPVGSILVPFISMYFGGFFIGWAKPVPFNPLALHKDYRYGPLKVAVAGPLSNLALAIAFGLIIRFMGGFLGASMLTLIAAIVYINLVLFIFNMMPIPPLDGSKVLSAFLPPEQARRFEMFGLNGLIFILLFIMIFGSFISSIVGSLFNLITGVSML